MSTTKKPWYKTWWGILFIVIPFWVVVLPYLIWKKSDWGFFKKALATFGVFFLFLMIVGSSADTKTRTRKINEVISTEDNIQTPTISDEAIPEVETKTKEQNKLTIEQKTEKLQDLYLTFIEIPKKSDQVMDEWYDILTEGTNPNAAILKIAEIKEINERATDAIRAIGDPDFLSEDDFFEFDAVVDNMVMGFYARDKALDTGEEYLQDVLSTGQSSFSKLEKFQDEIKSSEKLFTLAENNLVLLLSNNGVEIPEN